MLLQRDPIDDFWNLAKETSDLILIHGDQMLLEHKTYNVFVPFLAKKLLKDEDRVRILDEFSRKIRLEVVDEGIGCNGFFDPKSYSITIKGALLDDMLNERKLNGDESNYFDFIQNLIKRKEAEATLCEEIAHSFEYILNKDQYDIERKEREDKFRSLLKKKIPNGKLQNFYFDKLCSDHMNVSEYYGRLGIFAYYLEQKKTGKGHDLPIERKAALKALEDFFKYSEQKQKFKRLLKTNFEYLYELYENMKTFYSFFYPDEYAHILSVENTKRNVELLMSNSGFFNHVFGYSLAEKEVMEGKDIKDLFNQQRSEIYKKINKEYNEFFSLLEREIKYGFIKKNIELLEYDPKSFYKKFLVRKNNFYKINKIS